MSWPERELSEVADFLLGKMLDQKKNKGDPQPYLANVNVRWGTFELDNLREMRFEPHEKERFGLRDGDIVMCEGGEPGRCAIWNEKLPDMMFQKALHRIRPHKCLDNKFLYYSFLQKGRRNGFQGLFTGSTIKHLPKEKLAKVKVEVPPLPIQRRIAEVLTNYDDLIENNKRRIALLEEAARLLYREWFVHFRFPGHDHVKIIDGVPEGWSKVSFSDVFKTTSGGTPSRKKPEFYTGTINWAKTQELNGRYIFETEEKITEDAVNNSSAKVYPIGTLLVSIYGGTNIGRTALLSEESASNQACVACFPKESKRDNFYAHQWFRENRAYLIGLSQGAAQTNISQRTLNAVEILWPSRTVRETFFDSVEKMYEQIKLLSVANERLIKARDLLLPRLMDGRVEV